MYLLIVIISIIHLYLSFKDTIYGLCSLLAIKILVPDNVRSVFVELSLNSFCSIILFAFFLLRIIKKQTKGLHSVDKSQIVGICLFIIYCILVAFFSDYTPFEIQLKFLMQNIVLNYLPIIVAIGTITNKTELMLVVKTFVVALIICNSYGLICWVLKLAYPYNAWVALYFDAARPENYDSISESSMGGVIGRIIGTATSDSWSYGMFISVCFMISYIIYSSLKNKITLFCLGLSMVCIVLTVRRAPIIALLSFFLVLFVSNSKRVNVFLKPKYILRCSVGILFFCIMLVAFPKLQTFSNIFDTVFHFWDDSIASANSISGSSLELRVYQLNYTLDHIVDSPLFGNGWGAMYEKSHVRMYGWESIVFTTLFQSGFLGAIALVLLYFSFYKYSTYEIQFIGWKGVAQAHILSSIIFAIFTDTIYPFWSYFGCVLINKFNSTDSRRADVINIKKIV